MRRLASASRTGPPRPGNLVVRGGAGLYFDRFSTRLANLQVFNYPFDIVGVGLGSFARPFPDLTKTTYPVNPASVPSPVPFYFGGVPLAGDYHAHQRHLCRSQLPHAVRTAIQRRGSVGTVQDLAGRHRLCRLERHQADQHLHAEPGHRGERLLAVGLLRQQGTERHADREDRRELQLQFAPGQPDQTLQQRPAVPVLVHLRQIDRRCVGSAQQRVRGAAGRSTESQIESQHLGL